MEMGNGRVKERIELSLDGRQIASVVVGALVLLGVVFVLGLNLGRQLAVKQFDATRGDAMAALDRPHPAPAVPIPDDALTFHDRLTKDRPPIDEAVARPAVPTPAAPPTATASALKSLTATTTPAGGTFSIQLMSTPNRAEADKLVDKLSEFEPRVEAAEVTGKGRYYRVRVGSYNSRGEAEQALKAITAKAGTKGMVVASRAK